MFLTQSGIQICEKCLGPKHASRLPRSPLASRALTGESELNGGSLIVHPRDPGVPFSTSTALPAIGGLLHKLPGINNKTATHRNLMVLLVQEATLPDMSLFPSHQEVPGGGGGRPAKPEITCVHLCPDHQGGRIHGAWQSSRFSSGAQHDGVLRHGAGQHGGWKATGPTLLQGPADCPPDGPRSSVCVSSVSTSQHFLLAFSLTKLATQSPTMSPEVSKAAGTILTMCASVAVSQVKGRAAMTSVTGRDAARHPLGLHLTPLLLHSLLRLNSQHPGGASKPAVWPALGPILHMSLQGSGRGVLMG
eukprot:superscaffoldBa00000409_g4516